MGRRRSEETRQAILGAALDELTEHGYPALTIEGIAARAGAGKQTIYRWWPSLADVVLDALLDRAADQVPDPSTGSLAGDLRQFLAASFRQPAPQREILRGLMARSVLDPVFAEAFRRRFILARRAALRSVLDRGAERGELDPAVDVELLLDVVFGVLWYRMLIKHATLDGEAGEELAALVLRVARRQ